LFQELDASEYSAFTTFGFPFCFLQETLLLIRGSTSSGVRYHLDFNWTSCSYKIRDLSC